MTWYKALSVKQPWAQMIAKGTKTIETRRWATNYRGPLLICTSKGRDMSAYLYLEQALGHMLGAPSGLPCGVALCLVDLVGCRKMTEQDEKAACCDVYHGAVAWDLGNVRRLKEPLPAVKGKLGLFNVELERVVFE